MKMREIIAIVAREPRAAVAESFGRPAAVEWTKSDLGWMGEFQTPGNRWFSIFIARLSREPGWAFEFSEVPEHVLWITGRAERPEPDAVAASARPVGTRLPTGRGEQFSVYSTVLSAMREFLQAERPERVRFKGATGRQTKFYQVLMKKHAREIADLGYKPKGASLVATSKS